MRILAIIGALSALIAGPARGDLAQQHMSHQRHAIPGGRAALLGGAYTALSDDPSGGYFNPAGLAFASNHEVSVNTWNQDSMNIVFKEAVKGEDFHEESTTRYASFVGGLIKSGILTTGYSILSLDNRNINQNDSFDNVSTAPGLTDEFKRVHQESNEYSLMGGSAAINIGSHLSLGLSSYYYTRTIEAMDFQLVKNVGGSGKAIDSKYRVDNQGVLAILGLMFRNSGWSFGLSYRAAVKNNNYTDYTYDSVSFAPNEAPVHNTAQTHETVRTYDEFVPTTVQLGVAYIPSKNFLLTADILRHGSVDTGGQSPNRIAIYNYSLGVEAGFWLVKFQAAIFTNNSQFEPLKAERINQPAHIDYRGHSYGLTFVRKNQDFMVGTVRQEGRGKAQIILNSPETQEVDSTSKVYLASWRLKL